MSKWSEETQQEIRLFSPHDPIKLATILKEEMERSKKRSGYQVFGFGTERKMKLVYAKRKGSSANRSFAPKLKANMRKHEGGTLIEGKLTQTIKPFPFIIIWVGFLIPILIGMQFFWLLNSVPIWLHLFLTGIPVAMIAFGLWLIPLSKEPKPPKGSGHPQDILDFLVKIGDARPE